LVVRLQTDEEWTRDATMRFFFYKTFDILPHKSLFAKSVSIGLNMNIGMLITHLWRKKSYSLID